VEVLESLDYSIVISPDEWCCGSPLFRTGDYNAGIEIAQHNVTIFNALDVDEIIVTCPGCYRVLTHDYPDAELVINKPIRHISQVLEAEIDNLPIGDFKESITYHDPCHLGRHCGIYDEPRKVIEKVSKGSLVEMVRSRENAMCCGNGAGLRTLFPEQAKSIGKERVKHARDVGAEILVTSCPFCKNMLESETGEEMEVYDLPELVLLVKKGRKLNID